MPTDSYRHHPTDLIQETENHPPIATTPPSTTSSHKTDLRLSAQTSDQSPRHLKHPSKRTNSETPDETTVPLSRDHAYPLDPHEPPISSPHPHPHHNKPNKTNSNTPIIMSLLQTGLDIARNPKHTRWIGPLLLVADAALCALVIWKIPCTISPPQVLIKITKLIKE